MTRADYLHAIEVRLCNELAQLIEILKVLGLPGDARTRVCRHFVSRRLGLPLEEVIAIEEQLERSERF